MAAPSRCHWYVSGAVPVATTLKVAGLPAVTVALTGALVTTGKLSAEELPLLEEVVSLLPPPHPVSASANSTIAIQARNDWNALAALVRPRVAVRGRLVRVTT
jgi:hypothetical protein